MLICADSDDNMVPLIAKREIASRFSVLIQNTLEGDSRQDAGSSLPPGMVGMPRSITNLLGCFIDAQIFLTPRRLV
jgi:hypothetical protein